MSSVTTTTVIGKGLFFLSSPLQVEVQEENYKVINENNKGIVSILRSEPNMATANSLRRNLSADLSSRKWLADQNDFSSSIPIKKIASSDHLSEISKEKEASRPGQDDVWMSIQLKTKKEDENPGSWSSILSQDHPNNNLPPPYVHPLDKRSSSLSEKSLQICTESLGSETGSEGFSNSYPASDTEEIDKEEVVIQQQQQKEISQMEKQPQPEDDEWKTTKCMYSSTRTKSTPRSFPPPLPSLSQSDGLTLHMQSRRSHGRLVLEAVSVPSPNFFHAERQDGRLVLKLNASQNLSDQDIVDQEQVDDVHIDEQVSEDFKNHEDEDGEGEDQEDESEVEEIVRQETEVKEVMTVLIEQEPRLISSGGSMNVHGSSIMFKKIVRIDNINPAWPNRFNREVNLARVEMEVELKEESNSPSPMTRLLGSPTATTTVGTTGSFNAYDYFWRTKPTNHQQSPTEKNNNNILTILPSNGPKACNRQELVFLRGNKGEYLVPLVTGCKDSRKSLLIWEPYCVATT